MEDNKEKVKRVVVVKKKENTNEVKTPSPETGNTNISQPKKIVVVKKVQKLEDNKEENKEDNKEENKEEIKETNENDENGNLTVTTKDMRNMMYGTNQGIKHK
jgi:hypothetical protein